MESVNSEEETSWILRRAMELGFSAVGVAAVTPMDATPLRSWLRHGYAAEMSYLARHLPLRADLCAVLPGVRSAICVALAYPGDRAEESSIGWVARYARGKDYHAVIGTLLRQLWGELHALYPAGEGRVFVDAGPLPERELARRAGLGWVGKNSCLIHPHLGSRFVLGEILTTLELTPSPPLTGSCGDCCRCLTACPTGALVAPGIVDARRCLSYLTIEHTGPLARELRPLLGTRLFGCDNCQDVCPWNQRTCTSDLLQPAADLLAPDLGQLLLMSPGEFAHRFRETAFARAKRRGVLRNACVVLGNIADSAAAPVLLHALQDVEPLVRGHAAWALGRLGLQSQLTAALTAEEDPWVREEILAAFNDRISSTG